MVCQLDAIDELKQHQVFEREDDFKKETFVKIKQVEGTAFTYV